MGNAVAFGKTSGGVSVPLAVNTSGQLLVSLPTDPTFTTITLTGAVTASTQGATKAYVDAAVASVSGLSISAAASKSADTLLFDGTTAASRVYWALGSTGDLATSPLTVFAIVGNDATSAAVVRGIWTLSSASTAYAASALALYRSSNDLVLELSLIHI